MQLCPGSASPSVRGRNTSEPLSSKEMAASVPCESGLSQIDYRGTWYAFYIAANFPEVQLRSYCVVDAK